MTPDNRAMKPAPVQEEISPSLWYTRAMEHLVDVVQDLSHARDLDGVTTVVRQAARTLTGADGASFILRDHDKCYYADENAIAPLWKGQRFPMTNCVSGWVMMNARPATIEDIYADERVPVEAYKPTFVKSMAMVPIRKNDPIGAIGTYWARPRAVTNDEVTILQALADVTSIALENVDLYEQLQEKIDALERSNYELSRFAWAASHDLKSPLRAIDNLAQWIKEDMGDSWQGASKEHFQTLQHRVRRMEKLLQDILEYSLVENKLESQDNVVIPSRELLDSITDLLDIPPGFTIRALPHFQKLSLRKMPIQQILYNLISNALKHHDKSKGLIQIDAEKKGDRYIFSVLDDGPGIDPQYREKIFDMFQTLKPRDVKEGSGMGLALVKKILSACDGTIEVSSPSEGGSLFRFALPAAAVEEQKQQPTLLNK